MQRLGFLVLSVPLVLLACGGSDAKFDEPADTGSSAADTGSSVDTATGTDSATVEEDAEPPPPVDTGTTVEDTSPPPPVDTGVVTCTEMYSKTFGGHCYFPINARQWLGARDACVSLGAHLVTIASAEEQAVVQSIASGDRWMGMWRESGKPPVASSYTWITSEPTTYTHWQDGEPNGSGNCARLRGDGLWADYSCSSNLIAICERE